MPFPIVFTSSAPAGGRPSVDFSGPVLFGKIADNGPVGIGPAIQPSGVLPVQSTGGPQNQVLKFASINKGSMIYQAVSTGSLIGAGPPPFQGFGTPLNFIDSTSFPHLEVWSTNSQEWLIIGATVSTGPIGGGGTANRVVVFLTSNTIGDSSIIDDHTNITVNSSVTFHAAEHCFEPPLAADPVNSTAGACLYTIVTTSGKVELRVIFPSGTSQSIARED